MIIRRPKHPYLRYRKYVRKKGDVDVEIIKLGETWSPHTTKRVRRLSDSKIFSNSLGVALHYGINFHGTAKQVEANCDGIVKSVYVGGDTIYEEFEWANDHKNTANRGDIKAYLRKVDLLLFDKLAESIRLGYTDESTSNLLTGKYSKFNTFKKLRLILTEMSSEFVTLAKPVPFRDFYRSYIDIYTKYASIEESIKMRPMARHMWKFKEFYAALFGLVLERLRCDEIKGQKIIHISYNKNVRNDVYFDFLVKDERKLLAVVKVGDEIYPRKILHMNKRYRSKAIPIYAVEAEYTYHSISIASKQHMVAKQQIISCCFGDIESVSIDGGNTWMHFKYGSFNDLDPAIDMAFTLERYYEGNMGSRIGTSVFEVRRGIPFMSIRAASIELGVPESYIRYSIKHTVEIELIDPRYQKTDKEPIADYYWFFIEGSDKLEEYYASQNGGEIDGDYVVL